MIVQGDLESILLEGSPGVFNDDFRLDILSVDHIIDPIKNMRAVVHVV